MQTQLVQLRKAVRWLRYNLDERELNGGNGAFVNSQLPMPNAQFLVCGEQVLTSWQTHGAKLEAVRAEFQTDPQNIRDVLRVWQLHGDRINSFLENDGVEANGGSGRLPSPSNLALNGEPSVAACRRKPAL